MHKGRVRLTWSSKVPHGSHHWALLLLRDHPVEERCLQMGGPLSTPPQMSSQSLGHPVSALNCLAHLHPSLEDGLSELDRALGVSVYRGGD